MCRSSARHSAIARPVSAWSPTSTPAATSPSVSLDSAKDFYELTQLKIKNPTTGIFMIGGGVPKNFTQDIVVAAEIPGPRRADAQVRRAGHRRRRARRRPVQLTLKEASSWGKVDTVYEQMVYSEATLAVPLIAGYAYHKAAWKQRNRAPLEHAARPAAGAGIIDRLR